MKAELQHFGLRAMLARWRATQPPRQRELPVRSGLERVTAAPAHIAGFDQTLVLLVVALLAFGLVMVYSASVALPDNPKGARLSELHFLVRHSLSIAIGIVAALLALQVPIAVWEKWAPWLFVGALLLLALVLLPFVSARQERRAALDPARAAELPAQRAGQAGDRRCTRPATWCARWTSRSTSSKPCGRWRWRWRWSACCCWPSPTWAPSSSSR